MKATWDKLDKNWMQFEVEVEPGQFAKAVDSAFRKLNQSATVPGFRRGKAPRALFERNYGKDSLVQKAVENFLPQVYTSAVTEGQVDPIDQPDIELVQVEEGKPFIFKGKVQVVPEVTLGKLSGFGLEKPSAEIDAAQVDEQINQLRERMATLVTDEAGEVASDSFAVIDFEGFVDDVAFEGGKAENYTLQIGSGSFIPGFEEQLAGAKVGDALDVKVTFPAEYHAEHLAGKEALFKVTVKEVKRKELPELNDEFVAEASRLQTVAEMRADIEQRLRESAVTKADKDYQNLVVDAVAAEASVELPEVMVHRRVHDLMHDFEHSLSHQGYSLDLWSQATGKSVDELHHEFEEPAKKGVKNDLVLAAVAKVEGISVTESDMESEFDRMLDQYKGQEQEIKKLRKSATYRERMREGLLIQKTIAHLIQLNSAPQG
jgi:trigger factor